MVAKFFFLTSGNQTTIEKKLVDARKEAEIQARIQHKSIIQVLGTLQSQCRFGILLEYAPCADLHRILIEDVETPLPWKNRARFL